MMFTTLRLWQSKRRLRSSDSQTRQRAAAALGSLGDPRAVGPLLGALEEADREVRWEASKALAKLGNRNGIDVLIHIVLEYTDNACWEAARLLRDSEHAAYGVELLVHALTDTYWSTRGKAAKTLRGMGWRPKTLDQRVAFAIAELDFDKAVKEGASAVEPLIDALKHNENEVRKKAVDALHTLGDSRAVKPLIAALGDRDWKVGAAAIEALGSFGDRRAVQPLIIALKQQNLTRAALNALGSMNHFVDVNVFIDFSLSNRAREVRTDLANALRKYDRRAIDLLVCNLNNIDRWVREQAASTLVALSWKPENSDQRVAFAIASRAFKEVVKEGESAVMPLITALGDSDPEVRQSAAEALGLLGDSRAVEPLIVALEDNTMNRWGGYVVKWSALVALGKLGDSRAILPLARLSKSNISEALEAVRSLKMILEREAASVEESDLRQVTTLQNRNFTIITTGNSAESGTQNIDINYEDVRRVAHQELIRRGCVL